MSSKRQKSVALLRICSLEVQRRIVVSIDTGMEWTNNHLLVCFACCYGIMLSDGHFTWIWRRYYLFLSLTSLCTFIFNEYRLMPIHFPSFFLSYVLTPWPQPHWLNVAVREQCSAVTNPRTVATTDNNLDAVNIFVNICALAIPLDRHSNCLSNFFFFSWQSVLMSAIFDS